MAMWFGLSGAIIVPGLIFMAMGGIKKGIEFTGGTEIRVDFASQQTNATVQAALKAGGFTDVRVLLTEGGRQAFITTPHLNDAQRAAIATDLKTINGTWLSDSSVSGTISSEMTSRAVLQVIVASALIILYLAIRFSLPSFVEGLKFGVCAIIALLHDVLVLLGSFAILGYLFNWQIDSLFVTAMLTVIGFSVHDTIIIFDRMRENMLHRQRGESFDDVADRSIEQTFARSVYTSFTVILTLLAMLIFGGPVIRLFVAALLIGIVSGTYSSIFNATPLLVLWRRLTGDRTMGAAPATAGGPSLRSVPRPASVPRPRPVPAVRATTPGNGATPVAGAGTAVSDGAEAPDASTSVGSTRPSAARIQPKKRRRRM
jgi:preprotein translocase SecF subunit